eukprot:COSAG02_NODE_2455_length_8817_cov_9.067791_8_plen_20_part_01
MANRVVHFLSNTLNCPAWGT